MTYIVDTEVINPYGICLGEGLPRESYTPYGYITTNRSDTAFFVRSYQDLTYSSSTTPLYTWEWAIRLEDIVGDYIRRVYDLSDDTAIGTSLSDSSWRGPFPASGRDDQIQQTFETETEALEYVDGLGNPDPIATIVNNGIVFDATWNIQIDGIWINRRVELKYTGSNVVLYTVNDLINFIALFLEITPEEIPVVVSSLNDDSLDRDNPPIFDCEPYIKATVVDIDGPGDTVEVDIDFTGSSIPGDVTVTVVDGDPVVSNTMIENGDGAVTIHDNGNIIMSNDGGTFFLNEFGNAGFYANNDASLSANTQVQLGVGEHQLL